MTAKRNGRKGLRNIFRDHHGELKRLALEIGESQQTLSNHLSGIRSRPEVLEALRRRAAELKVARLRRKTV